MPVEMSAWMVAPRHTSSRGCQQYVSWGLQRNGGHTQLNGHLNITTSQKVPSESAAGTDHFWPQAYPRSKFILLQFVAPGHLLILQRRVQTGQISAKHRSGSSRATWRPTVGLESRRQPQLYFYLDDVTSPCSILTCTVCLII